MARDKFGRTMRRTDRRRPMRRGDKVCRRKHARCWDQLYGAVGTILKVYERDQYDGRSALVEWEERLGYQQMHLTSDLRRISR